jgi:hypothetical protein
MASSSGNSSSTGASDPVQAALDAAKQLSSIWRAWPHAQLLQRPPAAAWGGTAAEGVDQSTALLKALHDALNNKLACEQCAAISMEQLLKGLEQHQLGVLLARLIVWLQQSPEVRLEESAGSSSTTTTTTNNNNNNSTSTSTNSDVSSSSSSYMLLWHSCIDVLRAVFEYNIRAWDARPDAHALVLLHIEEYSCALEKAGEPQGSSAAHFSQVYQGICLKVSA